jgi:hypothetical protein
MRVHFHFLAFIYHVYYYSWSHDRCVFIFAHDSLRVFPLTVFPVRLIARLIATLSDS